MARVAGRRVTRVRVLGALLVVVVVLLVGGAATMVQYNQLNGPEQAVLDYAMLLADGRAGEAGRRVPPTASDQGYRLDDTLLSDAVLARATDRIRPLSAQVEQGRPGGDGVAVGDTVVVDLTYSLGRQSAVAALTVRRESDGFTFAHRWQVLTPLLVPVVLQSNLPTLGTASLGGTELPLVGSGLQDGSSAPQPVLLYPAVYPLTTPTRPLLTAGDGSDPATAVVVHPAAAQPSPPTLLLPLTWSASQELVTRLTAEVVQPFTQCVAEGRAMRSASCPAGLYALRDKPGLTSDLLPSAPSLGVVTLGPRSGEAVAGFSFTQTRVRWTNGPATGTQVPLTGTVVFSTTDDRIVTVTFTTPS